MNHTQAPIAKAVHEFREFSFQFPRQRWREVELLSDHMLQHFISFFGETERREGTEKRIYTNKIQYSYRNRIRKNVEMKASQVMH